MSARTFQGVKALVRLTLAAGLTLAFSAWNSTANSQTVNSVQASIVNGSDALITFDLDDSRPEPLRVDLFYSHDGGTTYRAAFGNLAGDVGSGVFKGPGKAITWQNFAQQLSGLGGRQVSFRVLARREATVYVAQFESDVTSATEGMGTYLAKVKLTLPFTGVVRYNIYEMSNVVYGQASGNDIEPLPGTLQFTNSTEAMIPITILDDLVIEDTKALIIDLEFDELLGYTLGPKFRHTVVLYDNDNYWNGVLKTDNTEAGFRMQIRRQDGIVAADIVTSGSNAAQQAGAFPPAPDGTWAVSYTSFNETSLDAITEGIPFGETNLFPGTSFVRTVRFLSEPGPGHGMQKIDFNGVIMGAFTDVTASADSSLAYLTRQAEGVFILVRDVPLFNPPKAPSFPIPASHQPSQGGQ